MVWWAVNMLQLPLRIRQIVDMLFDLQRKTKATLVLVTHDERLAALCDRTIHMADGRVVADRERVAA